MGPPWNVGCLKQEFSVKFCEFYKMGVHVDWVYPRGSMYGIFTYIYHKSQLNVGKYTIHGWYGYVNIQYDSINICCSMLLKTLFAFFPRKAFFETSRSQQAWMPTEEVSRSAGQERSTDIF